MFPFYPFLYEKESEESFQPIPLYIEDFVYPIEDKIEEVEKETVIIIDLL